MAKRTKNKKEFTEDKTKEGRERETDDQTDAGDIEFKDDMRQDEFLVKNFKRKRERDEEEDR